MPSSQTVESELADILVAVVDCDRSQIRPDAELARDLGVDSLAIVEIGEALGARFDTYLSDERIDGLVTVQDAVDAVEEARGSAPGSPAPRAAGVTSGRGKKIAVLVAWFIVAGVAIGLGLGALGAATVKGLGLRDVEHPTVDKPTASAPATSEPAETPATTPPTTPPPVAAPTSTISASAERVGPGQRITFTGRIVDAAKGAVAQVQRRDGGGWVDFPVETRLKEDGRFSVYVQTSKVGKPEFRLKLQGSGKATPTVKVQIG